MSRVTNLILTFSGLEDENQIDIVNQFFVNNKEELSHQTGLTSIHDSSLPDCWYGGKAKGFEKSLYLGAYNWFDLPGFLNHLKSIPWRWPETVQLLVCGQDDDVFKSLSISEM